MPLSERGLRCITYDRRGHGRSDDPGRGYDFDTLAADLAMRIEQLDLHEVTLVSHSMGSVEVVRSLSRYGVRRIARVPLVSPITPSCCGRRITRTGFPSTSSMRISPSWSKLD